MGESFRVEILKCRSIGTRPFFNGCHKVAIISNQPGQMTIATIKSSNLTFLYNSHQHEINKKSNKIG